MKQSAQPDYVKLLQATRVLGVVVGATEVGGAELENGAC
jgi:hypothetical protein